MGLIKYEIKFPKNKIEQKILILSTKYKLKKIAKLKTIIGKFI